MVHRIGFGLGNAADEDAASLQAVANASGGRYVTAGSAEELKEALVQTVATSFSVFNGSAEVARGSLGSNKRYYLPEGNYRVELHSSPPREMPVSLSPRDSVTLTLEKQGGVVSHSERRGSLPHTSCEDAIASMEQSQDGNELQRPLATVTN